MLLARLLYGATTAKQSGDCDDSTICKGSSFTHIALFFGSRVVITPECCASNAGCCVAGDSQPAE
jgi:hypothetical protein